MDGKQRRRLMFDAFRGKIERLAAEQVAKGRPPCEFFIVLIDKDDPIWSQAIRANLPNVDMESHRGTGKTGVMAMVFLMRGAPLIFMAFGGKSRELMTPDPQGLVKVAVFGDGGIDIWTVDSGTGPAN